MGPDDCDCVTTGELTDIFCRIWGEGIQWENVSVEGPHEAKFLKLDCSKMKSVFNWQPHWHIDIAIAKTIEWAKAWRNDEDIASLMEKQIREFMK